jgi:hypothetical protein
MFTFKITKDGYIIENPQEYYAHKKIVREHMKSVIIEICGLALTHWLMLLEFSGQKSKEDKEDLKEEGYWPRKRSSRTCG